MDHLALLEPAHEKNISDRSMPVVARVLHVINGEHYAGAERVQDLLAAELPKLGFEIAFACVKPGQFPSARKTKQAKLHLMPMRGRFDHGCAVRLENLIRSEQFDLIHAHTPRSVMVGSQAASRVRLPLVYHVHSPAAHDSTRRIMNLVNVQLEKWSLRNVARLIAVSPSLRQAMLDQGYPVAKVNYVPNGVPAVDAPERHCPTGPWTLGMAALFRPRKGAEILLEALALLRSRGVEARLRAVGAFETPDYERATKQLADQLGIADLVDWVGFTGDVPAELRHIDLFVLPSLFGEGMPMVVLEALAAGLPVVASHVEGIPEAVRHRSEGLLVEPRSVCQLADALEEIIAGRNELDYETLSRNARTRHAECFSVAAMARGVADVYRQVLER